MIKLKRACNFEIESNRIRYHTLTIGYSTYDVRVRVCVFVCVYVRVCVCVNKQPTELHTIKYYEEYIQWVCRDDENLLRYNDSVNIRRGIT